MIKHVTQLDAWKIDNSNSTASKRPLVSVVIPTHNRANLLTQAIESVRRQTYDKLEIIVVDDASTDHTPEAIKEFNDPRIRYIRNNTSQGGAGARNTGVRAATGKFIAFLDDDDEWEPNKTESQLKLLGEYDATLSMYSAQGRATALNNTKVAVDLDEFRHGFIKGGSASALMAHASVLKETLFDESLPKCQDWDLCIRIAQKYTMACLNEPLVRYNDGGHDRISNAVVRLPILEAEKQLRMLKKHKQFFGTKLYRQHMCHHLLYGIKRRKDKLSYIFYVAKHYGILNVTFNLLSRMKSRTIFRRMQ